MASGRRSKPSGPPALRIVGGGKVAPAKGVSARAERSERGKRVQFDLETWHALDLLARDSMKTFQELADEAFRDLLRKHGRPVDLKDALRRSAGVSATIHRFKPKKTDRSRRK